MPVSSILFIGFVFIVWLGVLSLESVLKGKSYRQVCIKIYLLVASYGFILYADWRFLVIIILYSLWIFGPMSRFSTS